LALPAELVAVMVTLYAPVVPFLGVAERTPVKLLNETPLGSGPEMLCDIAVG
jgi:hypothetical protein